MHGVNTDFRSREGAHPGIGPDVCPGARRGASARGRLALGLGFLLIVGVAAALGAARGADGVPGPVSARVINVIDGDTILVRARIWIGQEVKTRVRLDGVDAPELRGACAHERGLAIDARNFVVAALAGGSVRLRDIRRGKYGGRVLARVATPEGEDLGALLVAAGLARAYHGGRRGGWCDEAAARS